MKYLVQRHSVHHNVTLEEGPEFESLDAANNYACEVRKKYPEPYHQVWVMQISYIDDNGDRWLVVPQA
jgi:hypothetical protein